MKSSLPLACGLSALLLALACESDNPSLGGQAGSGGTEVGVAGSSMERGGSAPRAGAAGLAAGGRAAAAGAGARPDPVGGDAGAAGAGGALPGPSSTCGDGVAEGLEACDDGNLSIDDGCSEVCGIEYLLDQGNLDLFEPTYDSKTEALLLEVKDDTSLYQLGKYYRNPRDVVVDVDAELATLAVPEALGPEWDFLGAPGTTIYLLEQTQQEGLPWPGWSTERLRESLPSSVQVALDANAVELAVDVDGPGNVFTFMRDGDGAPINRYVSTDDDEPDVLLATPSSHAHTAWAFTAVGDYYVTVTPRLSTDNAGTLTGPPATYRFHIGSRLAPVAEAPVLTVSGGGTTEYHVHDTIELSASQSPPSALGHYDWYQFLDGYVALEGEHGATLAAHAAAAGEFLYSAALLGKSRRIVAVGVASASVK